jgi:predicted house-cleaning noncanonical NTP pyrophosphatase (MazG superfamily)
VNVHKNPENGGDYTIEGHLLSFCPECGYMYPELSRDPNYKELSNREKRTIGIRLTKQYDLDYKVTKDLVDDTDERQQDKFVEKLVDRIETTFDVKVLTKGIV